MQVIPVIDLSGGRVVHARRGQRELYQPLRSNLCVGSEPLAVVEGLMRRLIPGSDTSWGAATHSGSRE